MKQVVHNAMKKIWPIILLTLCISVLASPKIEFEVASFDFGKIREGEKADYNFAFTNKGDDVLVIGKVRSSCGCAAAMLSKKTLAPGEESRVRVSFNSKGYQGRVRKTITVNSNDPGQPSLKLSIHGTVVVDITVTPRSLYINLVKDEKFVRRTIEMKNHTEDNVRILSIKMPKKSITTISPKLSFPITIKPGGTQQIELDIHTPDLEKTWQRLGEIIVETNSKTKPELRIAVFVTNRRNPV